MKLKDWNLPKGLNLDLLLNFISEKKLLAIIEEMANKPRKDRRIIFPSWSCLRKCLVFSLAEKFNGDFDAVMDVMRGHEKLLARKGLHKSNIKRLYENRKKEIKNEQK